jgi:hypothetical protein
LPDEEIRQQEKKTLRGNDMQELEDSYNQSSSENYDVEEKVDSEENSVPPKKRKKRGKKAQWLDNHVADMVDVICSNDYFVTKS